MNSSWARGFGRGMGMERAKGGRNWSATSLKGSCNDDVICAKMPKGRRTDTQKVFEGRARSKNC